MKRSSLASILALAIIVPLALDSTVEAQDPHHPDSTASQPAAPGHAPVAGMSMMNMMEMMRTMGMMGAGMSGMGTIDHVEGRIAFLRAELGITDAQTNAWNAFADALRANAKQLGQARASMMAGDGRAATMADRLAWQERWLAARLEGTRAIKAAFTDLYSALSDDQKKTADELLAPHMGMDMMTMMQGETQRGQMQPGQMHPGQTPPGQMRQGPKQHP